MRKSPLILLLAFAWSIQVTALMVIDQGSSFLIQSEYGDYQVTEPVLCELIRAPAFIRLKHIRQYGVADYAQHRDYFSRYDHSVGVFCLLRKYGAPLSEQIAGLLHDVSHTVFSHVGDILFNHYFDRQSYQDDIHEWYLAKTGIMDILERHGYKDCCSATTKKRQRMLEQDRPDLCADRIEYLLRGGLASNCSTQKEIDAILAELFFERGQWVFKKIEPARQLAQISLELTRLFWGTAWNAFVYRQAARALKRALELQLITPDDIHFSTDDVVWQKLTSCADQEIVHLCNTIVDHQQWYTITDITSYDVHYKGKCLIIDPWVMCGDELCRLSSLDQSYAHEWKTLQATVDKGWYIKFVQ